MLCLLVTNIDYLLFSLMMKCLDLCPQCAAFYGNRSACYLMLGQPKLALQDAKSATNIDPEFSKG